MVLLNIHYRNNGPAVVDNSGFRIYYTDELRKYDAAISLLQNRLDIIPQQQSSFTSYSYCPSQCFQLKEKKKKKKFSSFEDLLSSVSQDFADFRKVIFGYSLIKFLFKLLFIGIQIIMINLDKVMVSSEG